jgi:hypothetical protein
MDDAFADGPLVTGPAWPATTKVLAKLLQALGTRIEL